MESQRSHIDRRRYPRVSRTLQAWYRSGREVFRRTRAGALSDSGATLWTSGEVHPGDLVSVALKVDGNLVTLPGRAVWVQGGQVGVEFSAANRTLSRWCFTESVMESLQHRSLAN